MEKIEAYKPINKVRIVTAASLFDGHDAAINIMRRIIQSTGCEVIHLGHDRSVEEVVNCAIEEDANAIAMTSYQGGHVEYFKYMYDLLKEKGSEHIKIFGGGGGTILPSEIEELHAYGITRLYHPDDGRSMGLQGMINDMVSQADYPTGANLAGEVDQIANKDVKSIARLISAAENFPEESKTVMDKVHAMASATETPVLGITGTGGAGKSSLVDELVRRFLIDFPEKEIAIVSVDPSKRKTGGALLGDRIRMNSIRSERVYMRSLATRQSNLALSKHVDEALQILKAANYDLIILETSGIGQSDTEIMDHSDVSLYVMTPEFGAATQLEKIDMLDFADVIALNKFDKRGALDAIRDVKKQYMRNNDLWETPMDQMPVYGTIASQFNDPGMNSLYKVIMDKLVEKAAADLPSTFEITEEMSEKIFVIPPKRNRYLSEISESNRGYDEWVDAQVAIADKLCAIDRTMKTLAEETDVVKILQAQFDKLILDFDPKNMLIIEGWENKVQKYKEPVYKFKVRDKELSIETHSESLSHLQIPKVALPKYTVGEIFYDGACKKMFQVNFLTQRVYFLLKEKEKIQQECLLEKVGQKERIDVFITFLKECQQSD